MGGARKQASRSSKTNRQVGSRLITRIQNALSLDLLHPSYPPDEISYREATRNHCYVATEAAYHLFGRGAGFVPYVFNYGEGRTHWWLKNEQTGAVLDPTAPQLRGKTSVYAKGRRASFLTKRPSKRAAELIRRVKRA
jgi:hypothetical protein